ncbi:MAG: DUF2079 domain-containing protein, partial [Actinobacteria bacterium]|nr:DUF2079 domain-containing protein [Actinomycetota bacterium]
TWLQSYTLTPGYDRGYFKQAVWLINHGKPLFISHRVLYLLGDHPSPIIYPIAWLLRPLPPGGGLYALQAVAFGLAGALLYHFARVDAGLDRLTSGALVTTFAAYPALHNTALAGFHPEVLAMPAFIAATHFALARRWIPYAACFAVILATKEDMTIAAASLAVLLLVRGLRRPALISAAVALAWLAFIVGWLSPHFAGGVHTQAVRYAGYGDTVGEIARFMLTHPGRILGSLFTAEKFGTLTALLGPLLFLPLLSPAFLFPALPLELILLTTTYPPAHTIDFHYTITFTAFAFLATAMALGRVGVDDRSRRKLALLLVLSGAFFFVQYAKDSPLQHPWQWRTRDASDRSRLLAHRMIPPDAPVAVANGLLDLFSDRQFVYNVPMPFQYYEPPSNDPVPLTERRRSVDYAVIDLKDLWVFPGDANLVATQTLPAWGFQKLWERDGIIVFDRVERSDSPRQAG